MPNTRETCQNCRFWTTLNGGRTGDCENPYIRDKVICISVPCYEHPDPEYANSVGYRTAPDFGCVMFKPLTVEQRRTPGRRMAARR